MAVNLTGTWSFDSAASTDPEPVAILEGFNWAMRKIISNITAFTIKIVQEGDEYDFKLESTLKNDHLHATIGAAPVEKDIDGIINKVNLFYDEDEKVLVEQHRFTDSNGKRVLRAHRRNLEDNGKTLIQYTTVDVEGESAFCRRVFRRAD